jgi:hypothetical protein
LGTKTIRVREEKLDRKKWNCDIRTTEASVDSM